MVLDWIRSALLGSIVVSATSLAWILATVKPVERPKYGHRGAERKRALDAGGPFAFFEPALRLVAALLAPIPAKALREIQTVELRRADDPLGLSADELLALSCIASAVLGAAVTAIAKGAHVSQSYGLLAAVLGLFLPILQVKEIIRARAKAVARALPPAIEVAAMCMGAGLDFPATLRMLSEPNAARPSPLGREFAIILEQLELGHTRKEALETFAQRVPSRPVQAFVAAVIQAEQKGNPLARVLQIQGRMLNLSRSVAAEEAAARAGVLLILPMVFLLGSILLLLMGPFLVKGIGW